MDTYYVDIAAQSNGWHEVHKAGCPLMPPARQTKRLGVLSGAEDAVTCAKQYYSHAHACNFCNGLAAILAAKVQAAPEDPRLP